MGVTMTVLSVMLDEMADEDEADDETVSEEELMGSGNFDEDSVGIDVDDPELLDKSSSVDTTGDPELDALTETDEVPTEVDCCGSTMAESEDAWLPERELLGVDSNPLDESGIETDVDKRREDEEGLNRVGSATFVDIKTGLEVLVLNDVESNT
jgi:hypothetical protein